MSKGVHRFSYRSSRALSSQGRNFTPGILARVGGGERLGRGRGRRNKRLGRGRGTNETVRQLQNFFLLTHWSINVQSKGKPCTARVQHKSHYIASRNTSPTPKQLGMHVRVPVFIKCEQHKQFCAPFALPSSRVRVDLLGRVDRKQEERERGRGREEEGHRHLQCLALHLAAQRPQVAHRCRTYHPRQARQTLAV